MAGAPCKSQSCLLIKTVAMCHTLSSLVHVTVSARVSPRCGYHGCSPVTGPVSPLMLTPVVWPRGGIISHLVAIMAAHFTVNGSPFFSVSCFRSPLTARSMKTSSENGEGPVGPGVAQPNSRTVHTASETSNFTIVLLLKSLLTLKHIIYYKSMHSFLNMLEWPSWIGSKICLPKRS